MDIKEIVEKKGILEEKILQLLDDFKMETTVNIDSINLTYIVSSTRCGKLEALTKVECKAVF